MKQYRKFQSGLTLVELLVVMAITSVLMIGIMQILVDSRKTYDFQNSQLLSIDEARISDIMLGSQLEKTGFYEALSNALPDDIFPDNSSIGVCDTFKKGATAVAYENNNTNAYGICVRYYPRINGEKVCTNQLLSLTRPSGSDAFLNDEQDIVTIAFYFEPNASVSRSNNNVGSLWCENLSIGTNTVKSGSQRRAEIVQNVLDAKWLFTVRELDADTRNASSILTLEEFIQQNNASNAGFTALGLNYEILFASKPNTREGMGSLIYQNWLDDLEIITPKSTRVRDSINRLKDDWNTFDRIYQVLSGQQSFISVLP